MGVLIPEAETLDGLRSEWPCPSKGQDLTVLNFFSRLGPYLGLYVPRFIRATAASLLYAGSVAALALLVKPIMDGLFIAHDRSELVRLPFMIIVLYFLQSLGRYVQTVDLAFIGEDVVRRIRDRLLGHILTLEYGFFGSFRGGELISRITNDISRIRGAVSQHLSVIVRESMAIVAYIGVAIYRSPTLAFYGLVVAPLAAWPLAHFAQRVKKYSHRSQEKDSDITSRLSEIFNNMELIKAHHSEGFELERFEKDNLEFRRFNMKGIRAREMASPVMEFVGSFAVALVIWFGGLLIIDGKMSAGEFASFAVALFMIYTPLKRISKVYSHMFEAVAASERIWTMLDREPTVVGGADVLEEPIQEILFEDVYLNYGEVAALRGVTLRARRGEMVALVGDSGGGKSSLVNLIPRLWVPASGRVTVDGTDLRDLDLPEFRRRIGIVTQRVYVFNESVASNVAYGLEIDRDLVETSLRRAGAWDFVAELEDGIDSVLDEFGANLSGGQRQRLAIARALYRQPDILIFDEATSALDNRSEAAIQKALEDVTEHCITFVIAHRLSTVELADKVLVMQEGRVVAEGTCAELMEGSEVYRRLAAGELPDTYQ